jgi:hypothetical protein
MYLFILGRYLGLSGSTESYTLPKSRTDLREISLGIKSTVCGTSLKDALFLGYGASAGSWRPFFNIQAEGWISVHKSERVKGSFLMIRQCCNIPNKR